MTKINFLIAFLIMISLGNLFAQNPILLKDTIPNSIFNPIKNLRKAEPSDVDNDSPKVLDVSTIQIYNENLALIKETEFIKMMSSGDYRPEPFIDSNKVVKAIVLRKATELEKKQMKEMQTSIQNPKQFKSELIGKEAIAFEVKDIFGNKYSLKDLKNKVIVMNFWFVECKPCVLEIPELNKLVDKYKEMGVVFIGFALNDKSKIEGFLKTNIFKYNLISESREIAELHQVTSYPTHIIIDKNSIISYVTSGYGSTTIEDIYKAIDSLLK